MDKMITDSSGEVMISNDGATILSKLEVAHPAAKMLVDTSHSQDLEAGDGTTSVGIITGSLLAAAQSLLEKGIHPTHIAQTFNECALKAEETLKAIAAPVDLTDRQSLIQSAITALNSKVVSQYADVLAPMAADAVMRIIDVKTATSVDVNNVRVIKKIGGTIDDSQLVNGVVIQSKAERQAGGPTRVQNAKIGLIQFQLSPPKPDLDSHVVVSDYQAMDRLLKDERSYILEMIKKISKTGCNVLMLQKSILRDATTDLSLHFLAKKKIMVINEVERTDIEFYARTLGLTPCAHIDAFTPEKLGSAELVEEESMPEGKLVTFTGLKQEGQQKFVSVLIRGSNRLMLDEADRSFHDALCVVRSLVRQRYLVAGGGAPEMEVAVRLAAWARTLPGAQSHIVRAYAEALEIIPYTLAENAGLHPIEIVTALRAAHAQGGKFMGINVKKGAVTDMWEEHVIEPLLVSTSAITLATECARMILKIDDIVPSKW